MSTATENANIIVPDIPQNIQPIRIPNEYKSMKYYKVFR